MSAFRVGQKVVLAVPFGTLSVTRAALDGVILPQKGPVYTIREFDPDTSNGVVCIRLVEIINGPHIEDGFEPSFEAALFRPVAERKTSIEVFKALLTPAKQPEVA